MLIAYILVYIDSLLAHQLHISIFEIFMGTKNNRKISLDMSLTLWKRKSHRIINVFTPAVHYVVRVKIKVGTTWRGRNSNVVF